MSCFSSCFLQLCEILSVCTCYEKGETITDILSYLKHTRLATPWLTML
jgi:hypothetical protein